MRPWPAAKRSRPARRTGGRSACPPFSGTGEAAHEAGISLVESAYGLWRLTRLSGLRRSRRGPRGLSLFGSLLAMALLGTLVLAVIVWLEERALEDRARAAGSQIETLAHAVSSYVISEFEDVPAGDSQIQLSTLESEALLPDGFAAHDALGRGLQVMVLRVGDVVDVLVAETLRPGDTLVPSAALLGERYGGVRLGLVGPEAPTQLRGPAVDASVARFQTAFSGVPAAGALGVLMRFDIETVYGDVLYRADISGRAALNTMATDLNLHGNDIVDVGVLEAESFDVTENIETDGELVVTGLLMVGQAVEVLGEVTVAGNMSANTGEFAGTVGARTLAVAEHVDTATLTATGNVLAETVTATAAMTAGSAVISGDLQSGTFDAATVEADNLTAEIVSIDTMTASGHMTAASAGISRLTVGSCSGC